jgi:hypothetical protein
MDLITMDSSPCEDCNFKTGNSTCWYFGRMPFYEAHIRALHGCDRYRPWYTTSTVHVDISETQ